MNPFHSLARSLILMLKSFHGQKTKHKLRKQNKPFKKTGIQGHSLTRSLVLVLIPQTYTAEETTEKKQMRHTGNSEHSPTRSLVVVLIWQT